VHGFASRILRVFTLASWSQEAVFERAADAIYAGFCTWFARVLPRFLMRRKSALLIFSGVEDKAISKSPVGS
jgi:hypothetical protein